MKKPMTVNLSGFATALAIGHGHTFVSAIGELSDDPRDQNATRVWMFLTEHLFVMIDNGNGMNNIDLEGLTDAYKIRKRKDGDNGLFSIGLTAAGAFITDAPNRLSDSRSHVFFSSKKGSGSDDCDRIYGRFYNEGLFYESPGHGNMKEREFIKTVFDHLNFEEPNGTIMIFARNKDSNLDEDTFFDEVVDALKNNNYDVETKIPDLEKLWYRVMNSSVQYTFNGDPLVEKTTLFQGSKFKMTKKGKPAKRKGIELLNPFNDSLKNALFEMRYSYNNPLYIKFINGNGLTTPLQQNQWYMFENPRKVLVDVDEENVSGEFRFTFEGAIAKEEKKHGAKTRYYERCGVGIYQQGLRSYQIGGINWVEKVKWTVTQDHKGFPINENKSCKVSLKEPFPKILKSFAKFVLRHFFNENIESNIKQNCVDMEQDMEQDMEEYMEDMEENVIDVNEHKMIEVPIDTEDNMNKNKKRIRNKPSRSVQPTKKPRKGFPPKVLENQFIAQSSRSYLLGFSIDIDDPHGKIQGNSPFEKDHYNGDSFDISAGNLRLLTPWEHNVKTNNLELFKMYEKEALNDNVTHVSESAINDYCYLVLGSLGMSRFCNDRSSRKTKGTDETEGLPTLYKQMSETMGKILPNMKPLKYNYATKKSRSKKQKSPKIEDSNDEIIDDNEENDNEENNNRKDEIEEQNKGKCEEDCDDDCDDNCDDSDDNSDDNSDNSDDDSD